MDYETKSGQGFCKRCRCICVDGAKCFKCNLTVCHECDTSGEYNGYDAMCHDYDGDDGFDVMCNKCARFYCSECIKNVTDICESCYMMDMMDMMDN